MWIYEQRTGDLFQDGQFICTGYSGHGEGRNNPALQAVRAVGPIPLGLWRIGPPHLSTTTGPVTMNLDPEQGTNTFARSLFRIHGDNSRGDGSASDGCIILGRAYRLEIAASGDTHMAVV